MAEAVSSFWMLVTLWKPRSCPYEIRTTDGGTTRAVMFSVLPVWRVTRGLSMSEQARTVASLAPLRLRRKYDCAANFSGKLGATGCERREFVRKRPRFLRTAPSCPLR